MKERLEKALQIALQRAHDGDASHAAMLGDLRYWSIIPSTCNRAWQDAKRLINEIEALEAAEGIQHVRVKRPSCPICGGRGMLDDIPCWICV